MQQADRLLGQMSREFGAVDGDVGVEIGKQLARAAGDARQRHTNRARNVTARVGLCRQHIDHCECAGLEPPAKFIAGNGRNLRGGRRGFSFGWHSSKSAAQPLHEMIIPFVKPSGKQPGQLLCDIRKAAVALCRRGNIRSSPITSITRWRIKSARSDGAVRANENSTLICLRSWLRSRSIRAAE
jgi:hypothetical protein